jgi:uncharacterized membrane protein YdcZ (DUF606 family)
VPVEQRPNTQLHVLHQHMLLAATMSQQHHHAVGTLCTTIILLPYDAQHTQIARSTHQGSMASRPNRLKLLPHTTPAFFLSSRHSV